MSPNKYETADKIVSPEVDLEKYLNKKVEDEFFPDTGKWYMSCFDRPKGLEMTFLPCHLDDEKWLAKMLMKFCNLPQEKYKDVLSYVKTSDVFYNKKKEYGLRIVKWQIGFIKNGGEGYVLKDQHGGVFWKISENCDKSFRWAVIDTLNAIGMNVNLIEEGLEKYSDGWRDIYIKHAFRNKYEPVVYNFLGRENDKNYPDVSEEFKKAWITMRKYEYYKEHRESVDLYGNIEPEMEISFEEYGNLNKFVENEAKKRNDEINKINNNDRLTRDEYNDIYGRITGFGDSEEGAKLDETLIKTTKVSPQKKKSFFSRFKK